MWIATRTGNSKNVKGSKSGVFVGTKNMKNSI